MTEEVESNDEFDAEDASLAEAVAEVASEIKPTRRRSTGAKPGDGTNQVLIRASVESHQRWKECAAKLGVSMAEFVRNAADSAANELLDCAHAPVSRRWYPWGETCMTCGKTLRDRSGWLVDPDSIAHVRPVNANPGAYRKKY